MASKVSAKSFKKFLKGNKKGGVSSVEANLDGADSSLTISKTTDRKRSRGDPDAKVQSKMLDAETRAVGPITLSSHEERNQVEFPSQDWRANFEEFVGVEPEVKSVWDKRFPSDVLIENYICTDEDRNRVRLAGAQNANYILQDYLVKAAGLSRLISAESSRNQQQLSEENAQLRCQIFELEGHISQVDVLEENLAATIKRANNLDQDKLELLKENERLKECNVALENKVVWQRELFDASYNIWLAKEEEMKKDLAAQFQAGYDRAFSQISCLYPDLDVKDMDVCKVVKEGQLVEESDEEEDEA